MKGTTIITLTGESITEALDRYIKSHLVKTVHVLGWSVDSSFGQPNVIVKIEETGVSRGLDVSSSAEPATVTDAFEPVLVTGERSIKVAP